MEIKNLFVGVIISNVLGAAFGAWLFLNAIIAFQQQEFVMVMLILLGLWAVVIWNCLNRTLDLEEKYAG